MVGRHGMPDGIHGCAKRTRMAGGRVLHAFVTSSIGLVPGTDAELIRSSPPAAPRPLAHR